MKISTNIKRPDNWYQGTRIVITDSYYNRLMGYDPYFETDYNTYLGQNDLSDDVLKHVNIPDNYIKTYLDSDPNYKIIVYALAYDGVIDIARDEKQTYYKYINNEEVKSLFTNDCLVNNGDPINNHERNFIQKNITTNNAAYNKYFKFEITPESVTASDNNRSSATQPDDDINTNPSTPTTPAPDDDINNTNPTPQQNVKYDDIELYFTYEYSVCNIDKFLNCAEKTSGATDLITIDNTITYDGSSEFVISNDGEFSYADSETDENTKANENDNNNNVQMFGNVSKSKLDNQTSSYINYKSNRNSDYSPVLSLEAYDKDHTFLGWYKIHSTKPYTLGTNIQFSSLFEGFVSSQKVATFDYNKLNDLSDAEKYVYFFAVYSTQQNEIIPFENRKMRIMKAY